MYIHHISRMVGSHFTSPLLVPRWQICCYAVAALESCLLPTSHFVAGDRNYYCEARANINKALPTALNGNGLLPLLQIRHLLLASWCCLHCTTSNTHQPQGLVLLLHQPVWSLLSRVWQLSSPCLSPALYVDCYVFAEGLGHSQCIQARYSCML
jgi:hypothetical protein